MVGKTKTRSRADGPLRAYPSPSRKATEEGKIKEWGCGAFPKSSTAQGDGRGKEGQNAEGERVVGRNAGVSIVPRQASRGRFAHLSPGSGLELVTLLFSPGPFPPKSANGL